MVYDVINVKGNELLELFPEKQRRFISPDNSVVLASFDDKDEIIAVAAFSGGGKMIRGKVKLEAIYVKEEYRRLGYGIELIGFAEDYFRKLGISFFFVKTIGTEEDEIHLLYDFIRKCDYFPIVFDGHLTFHSLRSIKEHGVIERFVAATEKEKRIIRIDDRKDKRLFEFARNAFRTGIRFETEEYNPEFCRFFVKDGHIVAAALADRLESGELFISDFFLSDREEDLKLMCAAGVAVICHAMELYPEDFTVIIQTMEDTGYKFVKDFFGEPDEEYFYQEFGKDFEYKY